MQIYHNANQSFIEDAGTGDLYIRAADNLRIQSYGDNEDMIKAVKNGAVTLYHNNGIRLATTAAGIDVTGNVTSDSLTVTGTLGTWSIDGQGAIQNFTRASANYIKASAAGGYLVFQTGGAVARLTVLDTGIDVTGTATMDGLTLGFQDVVSFNTTSNSIGNDYVGKINAVVGSAQNEVSKIELGNVGSSENSGNFLVSTADAGTLKSRALFDYNGDVSFYEDTGTTPKFFWDASAESLGIGTSSPSTALDVVGTATISAEVNVGSYSPQTAANLTARINGTAIEFGHAVVSSGYYGTLGTNATNGYPYMAFSADADASGNTFTTRGFKGNVIQGTTSGHLTFNQLTTASASGQTLSERMRIDSSGNVLVGKTAQGASTIGAELGSTGWVSASRDGNTSAFFNRSTSDGEIVRLTKDGATVGSIGTEGGNLTIDGSIATGKTGIEFSGAEWFPRESGANVDGVTSLGSSTMRFKDLYLSGTATMGGLTVDGGAVAFNDDTDDSNVTIEATASGKDARLNLYGNSAGVSQIRFGDEASTNIGLLTYDHPTNSMGFRANGVERMRIDSDGEVGIGTSSPDRILHVNKSFNSATEIHVDNSNTGNAAYAGLYLQGQGNNFYIKNWGDGVTGKSNSTEFISTAGGSSFVFEAANYIFNETGIDADFRVESNGNANMLFVDGGNDAVGIGTSSPSRDLSLNSSGTTALQITNDTVGTSTTDGFQIKHYTSGATQLWGYEASYMAFATSNTEAMRIDSSGQVQLGASSITTTQSDALLSVRSAGPAIEFGHNNGAGYGSTIGGLASNGKPYMAFSAEPATTAVNAFRTRGLKGTVISGGTSGELTFNRVPLATADNQALVESMRIDSSGNLLVGTTSLSVSSSTGSVTGTVINTTGLFEAAKTGTVMELNRLSADGTILNFRKDGSTVGSISVTGSATAYNTSSDQRLKENIADADDAGSKIDAIQVRKFDWKADGSHQDYGMIAQELLTVAPEAVSQPEDPEEMMSVDYSKLVPMMLKEIQELRARVAQLES